MVRALVVTRPAYEVTTHYLFYWSSLPLVLARKSGLNIVELIKDRVTRGEFEGVVSKIDPSFIYLNGHGGSKYIMGHNNEILIQADDNESILRSRIVYALSCSSAQILGPKSISAGAKAYIGYKEDFMFIGDHHNVARPLNDKTAALFFEPSNVVVDTLLKGHNVLKAYEKSQEEFNKNINSLLNSASPDYYLISWLVWDRIHQVYLGDKTARI